MILSDTKLVDVFVANPHKLHKLPLSLFVYTSKLRYYDHRALDGGVEGLKVIREALSVCSYILKPKG